MVPLSVSERGRQPKAVKPDKGHGASGAREGDEVRRRESERKRGQVL